MHQLAQKGENPAAPVLSPDPLALSVGISINILEFSYALYSYVMNRDLDILIAPSHLARLFSHRGYLDSSSLSSSCLY